MTWQPVGTFTPNFEWQLTPPVNLNSNLLAVSVLSIQDTSWNLAPLLIRRRWANFLSRPIKLWLELDLNAPPTTFFIDVPSPFVGQDCALEFKKMGKISYHSVYSFEIQQHIP